MPVIDAHCHLGVGRYKQLRADELLALMDRAGVDWAVVCPVEEQIVLRNREGNQAMIAAMTRHPDRFIGFAVANPWYGDKAVKELRRALGAGLRGVKFNSSLQGFFINDEIVYPLIEVAGEFGVPVYFHTGTPIYALPLQLAALARDFPDVSFIMGHSGFADFWYDALPAAQDVPNIILETSFAMPSMLAQAVEVLGPERLVFGSDAPMSDPVLELLKLRQPALPGEELILGDNMARLLRLKERKR